MSEKFREDKAVAALTYLLQLSGEVTDKYWLNKVMYYIERESILQYGEPMFHDDLYSMQYGPIVSSVMEGIDSADSRYDTGSPWKDYIRLDGILNAVYLVSPGDFTVLSDSEIELIENAYNEFKGFSFNKIMNFFHKMPEYEEIDGYPKRKKISYKDLLTKNNYSEEEASEIIEEIKYSEKLADIYG